jgi:hypothetical protein
VACSAHRGQGGPDDQMGRGRGSSRGGSSSVSKRPAAGPSRVPATVPKGAKKTSGRGSVLAATAGTILDGMVMPTNIKKAVSELNRGSWVCLYSYKGTPEIGLLADGQRCEIIFYNPEVPAATYKCWISLEQVSDSTKDGLYFTAEMLTCPSVSGSNLLMKKGEFQNQKWYADFLWAAHQKVGLDQLAASETPVVISSLRLVMQGERIPDKNFLKDHKLALEPPARSEDREGELPEADRGMAKVRRLAGALGFPSIGARARSSHLARESRSSAIVPVEAGSPDRSDRREPSPRALSPRKEALLRSKLAEARKKAEPHRSKGPGGISMMLSKRAQHHIDPKLTPAAAVSPPLPPRRRRSNRRRSRSRRRRSSRSRSRSSRRRSRSRSSSSQSFHLAPSTSNRLKATARERPGTLLLQALSAMKQYLGSRRGGTDGESGVRGRSGSMGNLEPIVLQYLTTVLEITHPQMGARNNRELHTLSRAVDYLVDGKVAEASDLLIQRFKAIEMSITDKSWTVAEHLELLPPAAVSSTTETERAQALAIATREFKFKQGMSRTGGRSPSPYAGRQAGGGGGGHQK